MNNNITFKVPIIGDSGVGKTCFLKKLLNPNENIEKKLPSITIEFDYHNAKNYL